MVLIAVGVLSPVAGAAPAVPVEAGPVAGVVMPVDPPNPDPNPDPGGEASPAPADDGDGCRTGKDDLSDKICGHAKDGGSELKDKGTGISGGIKNKLKDGQEVADDVAKKVAEGANPNDPNAGSSSSSSDSKWIKDVLETSTVWIGDMLGRAAAWVITSVLAIVFGLGSPDLGADYIYTWTGRTFAFGILITIVLAFWTLAKSAIQARGLSGVRRAAGGAVVATAASMVTLPILVGLTTGVDGMREAMVSWLGLDVEALSQKITDIFSSDTFLALAGISPGSAMMAAAAMMIGFGFFCLFTVFFAIVLLFVMVLRGLFLQAAAVVIPVAYSGLAADETRAWPRTVLGWLMALLVAPFGIVIVLGLGFLGLAEIDKADSITAALSQMATSAAAMLGGLSCPWVFFKLFSFLGEDAVASMISQMRGAVVAGAGVVGDTVKSVVSAASSPTEGGPVGDTVKKAASQGAHGSTDAGGAAGDAGGSEAQAGGEQQGQAEQDQQKAKAAAAAAAVATGGASAAAGAGAGAGAAGSSGGTAASSSGGGAATTGGSAGAGGAGSGASGGGSVGQVAGAPVEGAPSMGGGTTAGGTTGGAASMGDSVSSTAADGGAGGGVSPTPAAGSSSAGGGASGGGSVGQVAGAPVEGAPSMGGGPVAGGAGGFAAPPPPAIAPAPAPAPGSGAAGLGGGSVGSVASAPPSGYGYNPAPPPPPSTGYSSSSLYGYNSPGGSGYSSYGPGGQGYRPPEDDTDTAVFAVPGGADEPVGADAFMLDDRYWEEV
ncbi:hypothetical protein [uncultured Actinomyces sp.]|uniref:hypothetical protein n=1 Tax=uncultured Actinomyces sp. TaxID=249061 RepID=UPI0028D8B47D|nr:hypothetical protein [uncultured Actinomyces sp.]